MWQFTLGLLTRVKRSFNFSRQTALLFVHIPKTAGSSFKAALATTGRLEQDYGAGSKNTSPLITSHVYSNQQPEVLVKKHLAAPFSLTGHFTLKKYADLFDVRAVVTFVREPIAQMVSHYNHHVAHHEFAGSFDEFIQQRPYKNIQSRALSSLPMTLIGYIGITEAYNESVEVIENQYSLSLQKLRKNIKKHNYLGVEQLSEQQTHALVTLLSDDIEYYRRAAEVNQQRLNNLKSGLDWVHVYGEINQHLRLQGCAFYAKSEQQVVVSIVVNGKQTYSCNASEFYEAFCKFKLPRHRYVGFNLKVSEWFPRNIPSIESVVIEIPATKQRFTLLLTDSIRRKLNRRCKPDAIKSTLKE